MNWLLLVFLFSIPPSSDTSIDAPPGPGRGFHVVWSDEFDGHTLDMIRWQYYALGKRRMAINTSTNVKLDGKGHLVIEVTQAGNEIHTGMVATDGRFAATYGYFECRAKLPETDGLWPAFWLLSKKNVDGSNPNTGGAEIDIFEYFHQANPDSVAHTLHWGGYGNTHSIAGPIWGKLQATPDGFHRFALAWSPNAYSTYVDGVKTLTTTNLISHTPEFIIFSVEVDSSVAGPLELSKLPSQFIVDYVRVYQH